MKKQNPVPGTSDEAKQLLNLNLDVVAHLNRLPAEIHDPQNVFLRPAAAAKLLDVSLKWLSAAREGRKGIQGPPFKKLGHSRTSPVRYNLAALIEWVNSFPNMISVHSEQTPVQSFEQFLSVRSHSSRWLFAKLGNELILLSDAINSGLLESYVELQLLWVNYWQWLEISAQNPEMSNLLAAEFVRIREVGLSQQSSINRRMLIPIDARRHSKILADFRKMPTDEQQV